MSPRHPLTPLLTPTGKTDDQGRCIWFRHRDGDRVRQDVLGGHVWRRASVMSSRCIFCSIHYQHSEAPGTEPCPLLGLLTQGDTEETHAIGAQRGVES